MPHSFMEDARQSFTTLQLCMFWCGSQRSCNKTHPVYFGERSESKGKWCLFPWFILIAILSAFWGLFGPETVCDQTKCYPSPL